MQGVYSRLNSESRILSIFPFTKFYLPVFYIKMEQYNAENS